MAAGCCDVVVVVVAVAAVAAVVIAVAVVAVIAVAAGFHGNALIQVSCELEKNIRSADMISDAFHPQVRWNNYTTMLKKTGLSMYPIS